jgi:hypothetical protein
MDEILTHFLDIFVLNAPAYSVTTVNYDRKILIALVMSELLETKSKK